MFWSVGLSTVSRSALQFSSCAHMSWSTIQIGHLYWSSTLTLIADALFYIKFLSIVRWNFLSYSTYPPHCYSSQICPLCHLRLLSNFTPLSCPSLFSSLFWHLPFHFNSFHLFLAYFNFSLNGLLQLLLQPCLPIFDGGWPLKSVGAVRRQG